MLNSSYHGLRHLLNACWLSQLWQKPCVHQYRKYSIQAVSCASPDSSQSYLIPTSSIGTGEAVSKNHLIQQKGDDNGQDEKERKVSASVKPGLQFRWRRRTFRKWHWRQKKRRVARNTPLQQAWRLYKPWPTQGGTSSRHAEKYLKSDRRVALGTWARPIKPLGASGQAAQQHGLDSMDYDWSARFMHLESGGLLITWKTRYIERFVRRYAGLHASKKDLGLPWLHHHTNDRLHRWKDVMLWCMQRSPIRALKTLQATLICRHFKPPRHMIQDSLQFLARHFLHGKSTAESFAVNVISDATVRFVKDPSNQKSRKFAMSQEVVQLLLKHCHSKRVLMLYQILTNNCAELRADTLLHFLERFADTGKLILSMEVLGNIVRDPSAHRDFTLSGRRLQSACVKLLRTCWTTPVLYAVRSKILAEMLEMGIRPNTQMYNVILLNMIEGGDFRTAWETYDIAKQSDDFVTDSITYSVLLKGARLSGTGSVFENAFREVREKPHMLEDLRLFGELLNCVCRFSNSSEYSAMLDLYTQHFDLRPLRELDLCGPSTVTSQGSLTDGKWPNKYILGQMILAYNKHDQTPDDLIHRYKIYHELVESGHPLISPLASDDYVANSFILAFSENYATLHYCTTVLQHMLAKPPLPGLPPYAVPTVQTWSILLAAYNRHRQVHAAEKVLSMMRARGIQPDIVTWNTLLSGYAAIQDVEDALGVVKRMEAEGFTANSRTVRAMNRLWNREKLLGMLKAGLRDDTSEQRHTQVKRQDLVDSDDTRETGDDGDMETLADRESEVEKYLGSYGLEHFH